MIRWMVFGLDDDIAEDSRLRTVVYGDESGLEAAMGM